VHKTVTCRQWWY